jgi:hypothetical protein
VAPRRHSHAIQIAAPGRGPPLDAWESDPPLQRKTWLGSLPVSAELRARHKTRAHLFCLNAALRLVRREQRRSPDRVTRVATFREGVAAGAETGMKDHDRWGLARMQLERKLQGYRVSSGLPALVDLVSARPIVSAGMITAELRITPRSAGHGRRARPPRDDGAGALAGFGNLVIGVWQVSEARYARVQKPALPS